MALAIQSRRRVESPERWAKALQRALDNGLEVFQVSDTGERMVTSASRLDTLHRSDGYTCTCEAALAGDPVCQHRAVVRYVMGWLPEPEAPAPVLVPAIPQSCPACQSGRRPVLGRDGFVIDVVTCAACGGSGVKPALQPVAFPQPQPIAA